MPQESPARLLLTSVRAAVATSKSTSHGAMALLSIAFCISASGQSTSTNPPVLAPVSGTYHTAQSVSISDSTPNAVIYYTTNGAVPTASSPVYSGPITVSSNSFIQAMAVASGDSASSIATATYSFPAATVYFQPIAGAYSSVQSVSITSRTAGAAIYYTTDGSTPTTSSSLYTGPISVSSNTVLSAMAVAAGYNNSYPNSASYTIALTVATPAISPASATYSAPQSVSISDLTPGAVIYYTVNGSAPTTLSTMYSGPFTVSTNETVKAFAVVNGDNNSAVASSIIAIAPPSPKPSFSLPAGTYTNIETITVSCSDTNATIYYTTDGSTPTTNSSVYTGPLTFRANTTLSALALVPGESESPVKSAAFTIIAPAAVPSFSPAAGKYTSAQNVALSDATPDAVIYYTLDGLTPTAASTVYTGPIAVSTTETVQAVALASGGRLGAVAKGTFTITPPTAVPVISPASGTYSSIKTVTITDATPKAVIYYTVNGGYPTMSSPVYTGPIQATTNTKIQALAVAPSDSPSVCASSSYTIIAPPPTITPVSGTFDYKATVSMSSTIAGATIHYTSDGSTPTAASPVYTGPIVLAPSQTTAEEFQAIVVASGYLQSTLTTSSFVITLPQGVLAQATVSTTPIMTIPPNFMGLSTDWMTASEIMGQASTGVNQTYRTLLGNLTQYYTAPLLFRIEGDDTTVADLQQDIEPLVELSQAQSIHYTLGVDLMNDNLSVAEAEASAWTNGIPNNVIEAIEIGNEPDNYPYQSARPSTYSFSDYLAEFQQWQQGIQSTIGTGIGMMGPSSAQSGWKPSEESALTAGALTPSIVSQHAYLGGAAAGQTLPPDYLLQPASATQLPGDYAGYAATAHQVGRLFRMGEINSVGGGGAAGISNSFSSALWSVDIMFNYLVNGMDGVNWHSGQYTNYALYEFSSVSYQGTTSYTLNQVNPLYYGLLTFAQLAGRGASLLPVATMTDSNVSIWSTIDKTSTVHMIVINKDEVNTGNVIINLPGYGAGTIRYLSAPSYTSTNGVTLGGQTFDGSTDGTIQGTLVTTTITGANGTFTLPSMPITTAAVIDFSK